MIALMRIGAAAFFAFACLGGRHAVSQSEYPEELSPREARRAFLTPEELAARAEQKTNRASQQPYVLTEAARKEFPGSFGIDVSHYDFDRFSSHNIPQQCNSQAGYDDPSCSCTLDWKALKSNGLDFVYLKASDGKSTDYSFSKNWRVLEAEHEAGRLYRGAYHFFRIKVDVKEQAKAFLQVVGAINGNKPKQLSPSLDMEPIAVPIQAGSDLDRACPSKFRGKNDGKPVCDLWYTVPPDQIVKMMQSWIADVEQATGLRVVIYTSVAWWSAAIGDLGNTTVLQDRPIWIARYTDYNEKRGPSYVSKWGGNGKRWGMPPLPGVASYPSAAYTMPHFWQWTEASRITTHFPCNSGGSGDTDLSWVPLAGDDFKSVFRANTNPH